MSDDDFSENEGSPLNELFEKASILVRKRANTICKEDLLYLYARFKYSNEGPCNVERPSGLFNFEAKSKWDSWNSLNKTINFTKEKAMIEYIEKVDLIFGEWCDINLANNPLNEISKADESGTFGIKMSVMSQDENQIDEADKTCFDLVQEGSLDKLKKCFEKNKCEVNKTDENGMTLLMWACDRGHLEIAKYIIELGADVNKRDHEGQTCLHYAVSCDYLEIIKILLENKIEPNLKDNEGQKAIDLTQNNLIIQLITRK